MISANYSNQAEEKIDYNDFMREIDGNCTSCDIYYKVDLGYIKLSQPNFLCPTDNRYLSVIAVGA